MKIVNVLTTDSAINALRRFSSRRGTPAIVYSDNWKNFNRKLSAALRSLDLSSISHKATELKIRWEFNLPIASHMGGAWQKLMRSVETALKKSEPQRRGLAYIFSRNRTHREFKTIDSRILRCNG